MVRCREHHVERYLETLKNMRDGLEYSLENREGMIQDLVNLGQTHEEACRQFDGVSLITRREINALRYAIALIEEVKK